MTEASASKSLSCSSMNMDGVEESPVKMTSHPLCVSAPHTQSEIRCAERRESCPTATISLSLPKSRARRKQKALTMAETASSVRLTGSPATPSRATPRTSVPLFRLIQSVLSVNFFVSLFMLSIILYF